MAKRGGRGRARGKADSQRASSSQTKRGTRTKKAKEVDDGVPAIFKEMLSEAESQGSIASVVENRPLKRRKVVQHPPASKPLHLDSPVIPSSSGPKTHGENESNSSPIPARRLQTITDDSESSESESEWEDVAIENNEASSPVDEQMGEPEALSIFINAPEPARARTRTKKKPVTAAEKAVRLNIHKMHVLYFLYHTFYRNHWCNDRKAQVILKKLVQPRIITLLNPNPSASQSQRANMFKDGLQHVCDLWYMRYKITAFGIRRPRWIADKDDIGKFKLSEKTEKPMDLSDYRRAAAALEGSADLGAQLFCCLLRAIGVDARLVCSLQPLGFNPVAEPLSNQTPINFEKTTLYAASTDEETETRPNGLFDASKDAKTSPPQPQRIRRLGQARAGPIAPVDLGKPPPGLKSTIPVKVQRPQHPVFWVEAFNPALQKWIAVDAIATKTIGRPLRLEPTLNNSSNCLTYVVAFEEDGSARDVTRRYTKAYNAKTRKLRVECTDGGAKWYKKALRLFRRYHLLDRDQLETAELIAKEASEGMPRNIQDFKNHPYYALERHLRHNEVIHPKQEAGRVNIGTAAAAKFETVYRRKDVHVVRSADKWFRLGRDVKAGEQALKHAQPRRGRGRDTSVEPEADDAGVGQYALFQTELYIPPRVVGGRIPKNAFGNLDVYVPSMVPPGAVHIQSREAKNAARLLDLDYADAVTGFQFKGRHGTAVIEGIIVASEYEDAVNTTLDGFANARAETLEDQRSAEALRLWKRFLVGLRVVDRLKGYRDADEVEMEEQLADEQLQREIEEEMAQYPDRMIEDSGGGFLIDQDDDAPASPTARLYPVVEDEYSGGFLAEEDDYNGGFLADNDEEVAHPPERNLSFGLEQLDIPAAVSHHSEDDGGGFLPESDENESAAQVFKALTPIASQQSIDTQMRLPSGPSQSPERVHNHDEQAEVWVSQTSALANPIPDPMTTDDNEIQPRTSSTQQIPLPKQETSFLKPQDPSFPLQQRPVMSPRHHIKSTIPNTVHAKLDPSHAEPEPEPRPNTPPLISQPQEQIYDRGSSIERDSLPSEDPEDEDAEPEWLL